ncbi:MAG: hypothetical protein DMG13_00085 [Acidobacteria bacterium]|nr:MAG: hypothetical protein DMG13_00085 [Acidobacteriota bacterium]
MSTSSVKQIFPRGVENPNPRYLVVMPILIATALLIYKTTTSIGVLRSTGSSHTMRARPEIVALGQVSAINALERSVNYFLVIWPALVFGILIGAAVRAFVSPKWFARVLKQNSVKTQLAAGLAGAPLMLCSCCVAPIFTSVAESSPRLAPALSLMLASPVLNPAALALTFMLFEPRIALGRAVLSLLAVVLIGPIIERICHNVKLQNTSQQELSETSRKGVLLKFLHAVFTISIRTVPGLIAGVIISMFVVQWLPAHIFELPGARVAAILVAATVAVPLALPTFFEIPLALGLLAAGFPAGAAVALLFAGPAINLPSLFSVARVSGSRLAAALAATVWIFAVCGGLLIA